MAAKDRGANKAAKKPPQRDLKQKRRAKQSKRQAPKAL